MHLFSRASVTCFPSCGIFFAYVLSYGCHFANFTDNHLSRISNSQNQLPLSSL